MANEIKVVAQSGLELTYGAYQPDGTVRTAAGTALTEVAGTGYYKANDANVQTGDVLVVSDAVGVLAGKIYDRNGGVRLLGRKW